MTTPKEVYERDEAVQDDADNRRPDYPASAGLLEATKDAATLRGERDALRAEVERQAVLLRAINDCHLDPARAILQADRLAGEAIIRAHAAESRAEKAEARVARVEALVDEWRYKRDQSIVAAEARRGLHDENDLRFHAHIMSKRLRELGAALKGGGDAAKGCHGDRDGDCSWTGCPQLRDGEPVATGRHCPLDEGGDDE